jgi:uncharacterized protein
VVVGVSRNPKDFSHMVVERLEADGRTVIPVNADVDEIGGRRCFRSLADVPGLVDAVPVMVAPDAAVAVVEQAVARGVRHVWLHRGAGIGAVSDAAVDRCREAGIDVVAGACPMMFVGQVRGVHRFHRWCVRRRFGD